MGWSGLSVLRRVGVVLGASAVIALAVMGSVPAQAASFPDVGDNEWFAEAVQVLSEQGIVRGKDNGDFGPWEPITRAEFSVLVARSLGLAEGGHPFTDFPVDAWYAAEIGALYEAGLANGVDATTFMPQGRISRQQAASLVVRALAYSLSEESAGELAFPQGEDQVSQWLGGFPDRAYIAEAHRPSVAEGYRLQIISGQTDTRFYPLGDVTRAQCVGMLYAALFKGISPLPQPPASVPLDGPYPTASEGSKGPHVLLLEQRLAELSYSPGPVDGVFDHRTRGAVIAFQKWEGLTRDGVMRSATWTRLMSASRPTPRQTDTGTWIEVSLPKQVFLYVQNGVVVRTLPTSTGARYTYRWAPYTVLRKPIADGPRYRALYLVPGNVLAIHGYPSVPTYPASGGCVRLQKWDMDDLRAKDSTSPMIPNGTRVYIR